MKQCFWSPFSFSRTRGNRDGAEHQDSVQIPGCFLNRGEALRPPSGLWSSVSCLRHTASTTSVSTQGHSSPVRRRFSSGSSLYVKPWRREPVNCWVSGLITAMFHFSTLIRGFVSCSISLALTNINILQFFSWLWLKATELLLYADWYSFSTKSPWCYFGGVNKIEAQTLTWCITTW